MYREGKDILHGFSEITKRELGFVEMDGPFL